MNDNVRAWERLCRSLGDTEEGLPVYRAAGYGLAWSDSDIKTGDTFWYITYDVDTRERRVFKLVKTGERKECRDCPLKMYSCYGIGCDIKEIS